MGSNQRIHQPLMLRVHLLFNHLMNHLKVSLYPQMHLFTIVMLFQSISYVITLPFTRAFLNLQFSIASDILSNLQSLWDDHLIFLNFKRQGQLLIRPQAQENPHRVSSFLKKEENEYAVSLDIFQIQNCQNLIQYPLILL